MGIARVILLEPIRNLGNVGDVVDVQKGFFRNYLFPQKKAVQATKSNIEKVEAEKKAWILLDQQRKDHAQEIAKKFEDFALVLEREAGENEQLYGSVSIHDIYKALEEKGFDIKRQDIRLDAPIKSLGNYKVDIDLHPEVGVELDVNVVRVTNEKTVHVDEEE